MVRVVRHGGNYLQARLMSHWLLAIAATSAA